MSKDQEWFAITFFQGGGTAWGRNVDEFVALQTAIKEAKSFARGLGGFKKDAECSFYFFDTSEYDDIVWEGTSVFGLTEWNERVPLECVSKKVVNMTTGRQISHGFKG